MVIDRDDLPTTAHAHELIGADHGDVPFSLILVDAPTRAGPAVHRHPYAEVFVLVEGEGTFRLGDDEVTVRAGQLTIAQPGVAHSFTNAGSGRLKVIAIHGASQFDTEWLERPDADWVTPRPG
jgi:mannose-6-phosphate isomerase-like protein (cupin superfamily)